MRIGEILRLKWENIDPQKRLIIINEPEKDSKPGISHISQNLIDRILSIPKKSERIFYPAKPSTAASTFTQAKKRLAAKLNNPRLLRITFHTFRHWEATMEYHKTKDLLHVMQLLGHRNIKNTLVYTQLVNFENDDYHSATAKTIEQAQKLVETGFEYVCTHDSIMLFRKRK
jgi:integrase